MPIRESILIKDQPHINWNLATKLAVFNGRTKRPEVVPAGNVRPPDPVKPQLFLMEHYELTSFKGDLARDELISSFSVSPKSEQVYTLISRTSAARADELTTTVMESQDNVASSQFNSHLKDCADSRFGKNSSNYQMDANFHAEGSVGFGSAEGSADLHVKGNTQDIREDFSRATESGLDSQISATNQYRSQKAASGTVDISMLKETESKVEKTTHNETDTPMNIGIFQLKEETITLLSLVDVTVGFRNTNPEADRTASLRELDNLLESVVATPENRATIKGRIKLVLDDVLDHLGESRSLLMPGITPDSFLVNNKLQSTFELLAPDGSVRRTLKVRGIITKSFRHYLRKPNTTVELNITPI